MVLRKTFMVGLALLLNKFRIYYSNSTWPELSGVFCLGQAMSPVHQLGRFVLWVFLFLLSQQVQAQILEQNDGQIVASVDSCIRSCYSYQEKENWCWAASLQTVLSYYNFPVAQRTLVKRIFGSTVDKAASSQEMVQAIHLYQKGKRQVLCTADSVINFRELIGEIQSGSPVIVGMEYQGRQHAMVLTQVFFQKDEHQEGKIFPIRVTVLDPSRRFLKERKFSWSEFRDKVNMAIHIRIKKESD